jgi:hypothetical protein
MIDTTKFTAIASATPAALASIMTFDAVSRTYTFTPTLSTLIGDWSVSLEANTSPSLSPYTWNF